MNTRLEALVSLLPVKWQNKAKSVAFALGAVAGILTLIFPESPKWLTAAVLVLTGLGVYAVPNLQPPAKPANEAGGVDVVFVFYALGAVLLLLLILAALGVIHLHQFL